MRRIIKPFTVEVRSSGRKSKQAGSGAKRTAEDRLQASDQPSVSAWPGIDEDRPVTGLTEPSTTPTPTGRILRALDEPAPAKPPLRKRAVPQARPIKASPVDLPPLEAPKKLPESKVTVSEVVEAHVKAVVKKRRMRPTRLDRSMFARGERWKTRLPIVVVQAHRQRAPLWLR